MIAIELANEEGVLLENEEEVCIEINHQSLEEAACRYVVVADGHVVKRKGLLKHADKELLFVLEDLLDNEAIVLDGAASLIQEEGVILI